MFTELPGLLAFLRCAVDISTIDVPAASSAGVLVGHADKSFVPSTAELALALMLDVARGVTESTIGYRSNLPPPQRVGAQLRGRTAGIIGYGAIGSYLADVLRGIGMQVVVCDPVADATFDGFEQTDLQHLLGCADFVLPLAPAVPDTENLINADTLALMRPGTILVNVSRGELLDEAAVAAALDSGPSRRLGDGCRSRSRPATLAGSGQPAGRGRHAASRRPHAGERRRPGAELDRTGPSNPRRPAACRARSMPSTPVAFVRGGTHATAEGTVEHEHSAEVVQAGRHHQRVGATRDRAGDRWAHPVDDAARSPNRWPNR